AESRSCGRSTGRRAPGLRIPGAGAAPGCSRSGPGFRRRVLAAPLLVAGTAAAALVLAPGGTAPARVLRLYARLQVTEGFQRFCRLTLAIFPQPGTKLFPELPDAGAGDRLGESGMMRHAGITRMAARRRREHRGLVAHPQEAT